MVVQPFSTASTGSFVWLLFPASILSTHPNIRITASHTVADQKMENIFHTLKPDLSSNHFSLPPVDELSDQQRGHFRSVEPDVLSSFLVDREAIQRM